MRAAGTAIISVLGMQWLAFGQVEPYAPLLAGLIAGGLSFNRQRHDPSRSQESPPARD